MWKGVNDFRSAHSDKWFVPSANELISYIYPYVSSLSDDTTTGGGFNGSGFWSSSEISDTRSYRISLKGGQSFSQTKDVIGSVRLCRAF